MIRAARWLIRMEIGIWRSLFFWVTRRVPGADSGVRAFSYSRQITPIIGAFIFVSLIELPVVHLLIPWDVVRLVVVILSVWGLLWMVGLLASMKVFPHLLGERELRVRYGHGLDVPVPWDAVASVGAARGSVASGKSAVVEDGVLSVPVMKQTRVEVRLREPTALPLPDGIEEVTAVRLYADDPRGFVAAARELVPVATR